MFVQGEQPLARPNGGLGLGLALVKGIIELHGGSVGAQSAGTGRGSRFMVSLPLAQAADPKAGSKAVLRAGAGRVLVVDDNVDGADSLVQLLRMKGYTAEAAHDAASALMMFEALRPDVAVLDIGLPDMDGYALARKMREQAGDRLPRLIALTGYGLEGDRELAAAAGFDLHLVKPVAAETLLEALHALSPPKPVSA
jgi:CheY-like chemotaxis protein